MNKKLFILFFLLFFLELVFAEGFKFPVFEQQNLGCDSGAAVSEKYGLNRVLLEWDADKITETMCDPLLKENESGYFCDATQLSIMAFKRFESLKEKAREVYAGLDDASKKKLEEVTLLRPAKLSDLGVVANMDLTTFDALLLPEIYSDKFKEDFDSVYGKGFFAGKKISISGWSFSNRPDVPGLYSVFMDCDIEMDGSSLGFSDGKVYFSFLPVKGLSELGAFFSENKLLWLPFDAPLGGKDRDYGSAVNGSIQLNDKILVSDLGGRAISEPEITAMSNKGGKALVEASSGSNFADTASGLVLAVAEGEPGKFVLKFNKPIPSVVSLFLPEEKAYEVYYTLTDSAGKPLPDSFFGEREFLLDWRVPGKFFVKDSFPVLRPDIKCSGWNDDLKSAKFKADVTGLGSNFYYSIAFLPEDTALSVLCVSGPDVRFDMNSYNGKNFVFVKSVKPAPNQLGFSTLRPWPFEGGFSLKDALAEVGKGNMCFSVDESGTDALIWNAKALREKVWPEKSGSTGEGQKGNGDSSASGLDSAVQQFAALSGAFGGVQAIAGFSALSTVESNLPGISAAASAKSQVVGACSQYVGCFGNSTFPCCDVSSGLCVECTAGCGCKEGEQCSLFTNACIPKAQEPSFANNLVDNMVVSATKTSEGTFELFTISGKKAEVSEKDLQVALADLESHAGFSLSASIEGVDDIQNPSMTVCDTIVLVPKGTVVKQGSKGSYWRSSGMAALGFTLLADDVSVVGISDDVVAVTLIAAAGIQLIVTNYRQALAGRTIYVEYPDVCLLSPHVYAPPVTDVGTDGVGTDGVGADGAGTDGVGTDVGIDEGAAIEEGTVVKIGNTYFVLTDNGVSPVKEPPPEKKPGDDKQSFFKKFMERAKLPVVGVTIIALIGSMLSPSDSPLGDQGLSGEDKAKEDVSLKPNCSVIAEDSGTGIATIECVFKYSNGKLAYSETRTVPLADLDSYGVEGAFFQATPDGAVQAVQNSIATMQEISDRIDAGLSFSDYEKILPPEMRLVEEPNKPGQKRMDCIEYVKTKIGIDVEDTANLNKTENPEPGKTAVIYSTSNDPNPSANPFWVDHTGIYLGKDAEGRIWVRSKWGYNGPVFDHLIDFVPPEYGTAVGFYTSNAGQASPSAQPEVTGKPIQATLQADQLVAVHMTDYFPDNGIIRTNGNSTSSTSRQTIHFSLNGASFIEVSGGDWTNKRFAILVPFEDLQDRVISFWARDTIIFGNFELPESAVIIGREEDLAGKNPGEASVKAIKEEEWPRNEGFKLNLVYVPEVVRSMGYTPAGLSRNVDKRVVVDDKYMYLERHSWEYVNSETPILKEGSSIDLRYSEAHWDSAFEELAQRLGLSTLHHESTLPGKLEAFLSDAQVYFLGDFIGPSLLYGSYGIVVLDVRPQSMIDTIASLTILIYKEQFYKGDEQKQAVFNIRTLSEDVISRMERKYNIKLDPQLRQEFDNLPKYETGQTSP